MSLFKSLMGSSDKTEAKPEQSKTEQTKPSDKGGKPSENEPKEAEVLSYRSVKSGEYCLHVYVEETRGLVHPKDSESTVDPIIKIAAFGKILYSKQKEDKGVGMTHWGEHFFFNKFYEYGSEFEAEKIMISVIDHNKIGFDSLIGEFEADVVTAYLNENHCILHKWVALSNLRKEFEEIKGFLKFSMCVTTSDEEQVKLEDEKISEEKGSFGSETEKGSISQIQILLPPQLQTKPWQMCVNLIKGENLIKMDSISQSIDPYVVVGFAGAKFVSNIITSDTNPVWAKRILLPFSEPTISQRVTLKLYDWDRGTEDELVGSSTFEHRKIKSGEYKEPFWLNIYGSQGQKKSQYSNLMNNHSDLGSFWKGRVLLSLSCTEEDNPKLDMQGLDQSYTLKYREIKKVQWIMKVDLLYGLSFHKEKDKYGIVIRWADQELVFDKQAPTIGVWEWYQRKETVFNIPMNNSIEELPDVFIYLVHSDGKISFLRKPASAFLNQVNPEASLNFLRADKSISEDLMEDNAGILKFRLAIFDSRVRTDFTNSVWSKPLSKPKFKEGMLIANLYYGQDLLPADSDGGSDPFLDISYYGRNGVSQVIEDSLNPIWYQRIEISAPFFIESSDMPPILLKMYDKDNFSSEFIGSGLVDIAQGVSNGSILMNKDQIPQPTWVDLKFNRSLASGKVLISFNFFEFHPLKQPSIYPEMMRYFVKVRVLGMRNLKSLGLMPVKKPFIKFNINSLRTYQERTSLREQSEICTEPLDSGPNPNIGTIIEFSVFLPKNLDFCPSLSCTVHDTILKGLSQPTLGVFTINLRELILKTRAKMNNAPKKKLDVLAPGKEITLTDFISFRGPIQTEISMDSSSSKDEEKPLVEKPQTEKPIFRVYEPEVVHKPIEEQTVDVEVINKENGEVNSSLIIRKPDYVFDHARGMIVEKTVPHKEKFMPLGWDKKTSDVLNGKYKRHYRYFINKPLEKSEFMDEDTFDEYYLYRGKRIQKESYFSGLFGMIHPPREVGKFKGWVDIISEEEKLAQEKSKKPENQQSVLPENFKNQMVDQNQKYDSHFIQKRDVMIRVYVCTAEGLPSLDKGSLSDPYVQIRLGNNKKNNRENYLTDKANAEFFTMLEFMSTIPGVSHLHIELWDYNKYAPDELIGQTSIDLENRYFSKKWRSLRYIPIETRDLFHPSSTLPRGKVKLWLEIIDIGEKNTLLNSWDIQPKPPAEFEIRVIVWDCEDCPNNDIEDASDLFVSATIGETTLKTDTHFRSMNGCGSFNWRMIFPVTLPLEDPTISFKIWDRDIFSGSDFISEATLKFGTQAKEAFENEKVVKIGLPERSNAILNPLKDMENQALVKGKGGDVSKLTIELQNAAKAGYSTLKKVGRLTLSFEILPKSIALMSPAGLGRGQPNQGPWLPPPVGRLAWTWNPIELFNSCIGPKARRVICLALASILILAMVISLFPLVVGNMIGNFLTG